MTRFVGRVGEIERLVTELTEARLLSLCGPGGVGKSRLSLELARKVAESFPDGVWLVNLASVSDPALVAGAVAAVLAVREQPERSLASTLAAEIRDAQILLVLDNCEHVVEAVSSVSLTLLTSCPHVRVLATSREPLGLPGETVWPVPALDVPGADEHPAPDRLAACESVRLFLDRAHSAKPGFALDERNAPTVAALCRALEGLPLAIELAAARVRALSIEQILERMSDRFAVLSQSGRAASGRHRTLRATIDWSFDLLSSDEQQMLRSLSIFEGGCTLEAVERVCVGNSGIRTLDLLSRLVEKSLLLVVESDRETRYRMLESIREYARERLREAGEEEHLQRLHRDWFFEWSERFSSNAVDDGNRRVLLAEHENLRAALRWSLGRGEEVEVSLHFCLGLGRVWRISGQISEARRWLDEVMEQATGIPTRDIGKSSVLAGAMAGDQGDYTRARELLEEGIRVLRESGAATDLAFALKDLAYVLERVDAFELARTARAEAVALVLECGNVTNAAAMLGDLGAGARERGDYDEALGYYREGLGVLRQHGKLVNVSVMLYNLGELAVDRSDDASATGFLSESLSIAREIGAGRVEAYSTHMLGYAAIGAGDYPRAAVKLAEAFALHDGQGNPEGVGCVLVGCALFASALEDWERAGRLAGAADALRTSIRVHTTPADRALVDRATEPARSALGVAAFERAFSEGAQMKGDNARACAMVLLETWLSAEPPGFVDTSNVATVRSTNVGPEPEKTGEWASTVAGTRPTQASTHAMPEGVAAPLPGRAGRPDPLVGTVLDDRYELNELLGRGGMGAVYRATHLLLGRQAAVKVIRPEWLSDEETLARFTREAKVVARLRHPHIIAVYDFGVAADGFLYLAMEIAEGSDLRHAVRCGPLDTAEAIAIARQICSAVHAAHAAGIIHRDIKPENVMVERERSGSPHVKVLDFGIARLHGLAAIDSGLVTQAGERIGTPSYMAPEQCEGLTSDARTDVYAIGCTLYEMVTGRPPFIADTVPAVLYKHCHDEPPKPTDFVPGFAVELERVILRALQKSPAERYQTAEAMGAALERIDLAAF